MSKNLFTSVNDDWRRIRAISSPAFTSGKMKRMFPLIGENCEEFSDILDTYAKDKKEIELKKMHGSYTMDVIAKVAFATHTNSHKNPDNDFKKNVNAIIEINNWKIVLLFMVPMFVLKVPIIRDFFLPSNTAEFFFDVGRQLIKKRKDNNEQHNDFLQLLIDVERDESVLKQSDANEGHHVNESKEEMDASLRALNNVVEKKLTENEILAQCWLFFIAGYETTASTLTYCSYELAVNPGVQQKLYEEIRDSLNNNNGNKIDYDTLLKLPYLDAVLSETLRKYPPVIRLERQAMDDISLGTTGYVIPKGMIAEIPVYAIHYDPEYYPKPEEFIPERFLPENRENMTPYTYLPFGSGPRNCIGMRFALLEAKLAIVNILLKFRFFRSDNTTVPIKLNRGRRVVPSKKVVVGIERR